MRSFSEVFGGALRVGEQNQGKSKSAPLNGDPSKLKASGCGLPAAGRHPRKDPLSQTEGGAPTERSGGKPMDVERYSFVKLHAREGEEAEDDAAFAEHAKLPHTVRFLQCVDALVDQPREVARTEMIG